MAKRLIDEDDIRTMKGAITTDQKNSLRKPSPLPTSIDELKTLLSFAEDPATAVEEKYVDE